MAISFIERALGGVLGGAFNLTKHAATSTARSPFKRSSYVKRGKALASEVKGLKTGHTMEAINDTRDWMADSLDIIGNSDRHILRRGAAVGGLFGKGVLGIGHTAVGAIGDTLSLGGAVAGQALGLAGSVAVRGVGAVGYGVGKTGWWAGKQVAKGALHASPYVAKTALKVGKETNGIVGGAAKMVWQNRQNPMFNSGLIAGAIGLGAVMGNGEYKDDSLLGDEYGGYGTNKGYMKGQVQQLSRSVGGQMQREGIQSNMQIKQAYSPTLNKVSANAQGNMREYVRETSGPMDTGYGATGDLVFALHNLRQSGGLV